ncbi:unnamed protein product [Rotaria socialis]|uniref:Uncharacterized protein n=1 Tax=Rotaria socialis TaxID=392032 RepID=A0A817SXT6_9BILA|nr:unnamed protein product [Rotaria socialis]CAF3655317.1 unnamed protein product [Rotaria socialis]CAF4355962.1 unnamed protein product [Rotaria socialis]CAF4501970.1 unnamed protein product [Rotaria socialis]
MAIHNEGYEYSSNKLSRNQRHSFAAEFIRDELKLDDSVFSHQDDCYYLNNHCHIENRGGHRYIRPSNCSKFILKQGKHLFSDYTWSYSYHGTASENVKNIITYGLKIPGHTAGSMKVSVQHGSIYGAGIYSTKIPLYAQLYAPCIPWRGKYVQTIFMLRLNANKTQTVNAEGHYTAYMKGRTDIHLLYGGKIDYNEIQFMTPEDSAVVLHALLVKVHDSDPDSAGGEYDKVAQILDGKITN